MGFGCRAGEGTGKELEVGALARNPIAFPSQLIFKDFKPEGLV
jgi:hypothetical protein